MPTHLTRSWAARPLAALSALLVATGCSPFANAPDLANPGILRVTVVDQARRPVVDAVVFHVEPVTQQENNGRTGNNGEYEYHTLAPGQHRWYANPPATGGYSGGGRSAMRTVTIRPGEISVDTLVMQTVGAAVQLRLP
jgi:hypothetical protein